MINKCSFSYIQEQFVKEYAMAINAGDDIPVPTNKP